MAFALLDYISVTQLLILAVGVTLVPLMSDMINLYIPIGRHLNKYLSFVLVGLLYMLSCSALYSFYYIFLPFYHKIGWLADTSESYAIVAVAVWVWFNTNYTYTKTLFTSPSIQHHEPPPPPLDAHTTPSPTTSPISAPSISIDQPASGAADGLTLRKARVPHEPHEHHQQPSEARYCNDCKTFKAPLTHHCSQCNKCIPNMDHHCFFTANCISTGADGNYASYFVFLVYLTLGVCIIAAVTGPACFSCFFLVSAKAYFGDAAVNATTAGDASATASASLEGQWVNALTGSLVEAVVADACYEDLGDLVLLFVPAVVALAPVGSLMLFHAVLIVRGETTLDFLSSKPTRNHEQHRHQPSSSSSSSSAQHLHKISHRWRWYHFLLPILLELQR